MNDQPTSIFVTSDETLCDDFEPCGTCGYDHAYEYGFDNGEIERKHREAGDLPPDMEPIACQRPGCYLAVIDELGTCSVHGLPFPRYELHLYGTGGWQKFPEDFATQQLAEDKVTEFFDTVDQFSKLCSAFRVDEVNEQDDRKTVHIEGT